MSNHHLMGPFVRRFLIEELVAERNLSPNTQKSYRDTIRLLFNFVVQRYSTDPTRVTVEQVDAVPAVFLNCLIPGDLKMSGNPAFIFFQNWF
jgi:site-specific recombinase XerD